MIKGNILQELKANDIIKARRKGHDELSHECRKQGHANAQRFLARQGKDALNVIFVVDDAITTVTMMAMIAPTRWKVGDPGRNRCHEYENRQGNDGRHLFQHTVPPP